MSSVGLLFVGAVLFVNGLLLLGRVDAKTAGVFNLFVGALQTAIPFYVIATADTPDAVLGAAGVFMFGFTYLWIGINNLAGFDGPGFGWYSAWVAVMAVGFGATSVVRFDDVAGGLLWFQWAVLWAMFFVVIGLGRAQFTTVTAWLTLVMSFTTCTVPAFVYLLGEPLPVWAVVASILVTAAALAPLALRAVRAGTTPPVVAAPVEERVPVAV
ncbi:hypothetical protein GCM10023340_27810 [Nocardioides marinquilinus]|uniref:Transporter n=1 Tax=Nocardioides marinquilinus TaxID=1210400 RepID=A0ABP9PQF9_9ACTN